MGSHSFFGATARERVARLFDAGSVREFLPPQTSAASPHLAKLGLPGALDDGVMVGRAALGGNAVLFAAQEGQFMGGAVGELHGAKIVGMLARARAERPRAVIFFIDSGGVRLHEANAGLIAISEIMRAVLDARAAGVPVIALIGGICGAFGGMGIVALLCSYIVMSEEGRLALSGPDVIETVAGVEEFDARDRALVWRVTGGKHRLITGDCDELVEDDVAAFREAATRAVTRGVAPAPTLASLMARQDALAVRDRRL
jgi:malonate decarboxylase beta subunit